MTTAVTGLLPDLHAAERAVAALVAAGFPRNDISVIFHDTPHHEELVARETDDTAHGIVLGALSGGALASLAFGALGLAGIAVFAAGPLLVTLTMGGIGVAAGGVVGALVGHGTSSYQAQEYETALAHGQVLVAVHTVHGRAREAHALLLQNGAQHMSEAVHPSARSLESEAGPSSV
jgi:hypothetical protein